MGSTQELNPSLWVGTSDAGRRQPLTAEARADVVVIGSGIAGLTTALLVADAGMSVIVVEAGNMCAGVTGYTTAKVTSLHSAIYTRLVDTWGVERAATYASANQAAIDKVRELAAANGIDCDLEDASAFTYTETADGEETIEREAEAAGQAGLAVSVTTETDLPYAVRRAVRIDGQAQFHRGNIASVSSTPLWPRGEPFSSTPAPSLLMTTPVGSPLTGAWSPAMPL